MITPAPHDLDVRPQLARGEEPFDVITAAVDALAPGQALRLIAPFRPVPLFTVMARRGFSHDDRQRADGAWEVVFSPEGKALAPVGLAPGSTPEAVFWPDPVQELDLAGMMPPEPMVRILETLTGMAPGTVLFALLDREPMFLFPELADRGHEWAGNFASDGTTYRLMVRRGGTDLP